MAATVDPFSDPVPPPKHKPMLEAVRDVVTVKSDSQRGKFSRSQTAATPSGGGAQSSRRTIPDEPTSKPLEKSKSAPGKSSTKGKKGLHVDVIDKLDISGVGSIALHHDGPFDACAPSRNRNKNKAPMMAWAASPGSEDQQLSVPPVPVDSRVSPRAQATMAAMQQASAGFDGPYPKMASPGLGGSEWSSLAPPKKRHDALAEAWGIAEPEPFEEFFAGGGDHSRPSSVHRGVEGKKGRDGRDLRDVYKDYLDERPTPKRRETRSNLPPPAPIALPGQSTGAVNDPLPSPSNYTSSQDGTPKRSKSLLGRIKKMKENPNIPLSATEERSAESSPTAEKFPNGDRQVSRQPARPGHRSHNSFLGVFQHKERSAPRSANGQESFDIAREDAKGLPNLPHNHSTPNFSPPEKKSADYFDRPSTSSGGPPTSPNGGLGRKASLMQRVVRGVRGNKQ
ncbi:hypothetical protein EXIGLDRAFT_760229 [Exidia glandulosa HHB12029]|uniref:Pal1-domain-containing protein n=1 Tax=Exidia glandulosa HHB12029 TaxID=1314781 RepID=A0A166BKQ7_EXIGL|nr:hypothetical protein EXIGLDRAFT_760229 [Exidia glandulosa HHB12029]